MRNSVLLLALFLGLMFMSCEKDSTVEKTSDAAALNVTNRSASEVGDIFFRNGMLHFNDFEHFYSTVRYLEEKQEKHLSNLDNVFLDLTEDEVEHLEDQVGFDNWKPLTEFEQLYPGFESRRSLLEKQILNWLDNVELDMDNDPDDKDSYGEEFRTLLNRTGEVSIAEKVVNFVDMERNIDARALDCRHFKKSKDSKKYDNDKRLIKVKVAFRGWPWRDVAKAKIRNFKRKKRWGKFRWRRSRAMLKIQVAGKVREEDCTNPKPMGAVNGPKKRSALKAKWVHWGLPMHKAVLGNKKNGELWGTGYVVDKVGLTVILGQ